MKNIGKIELTNLINFKARNMQRKMSFTIGSQTVHPKAIEAMTKVNFEHQSGYGGDPSSLKFKTTSKQEFGQDTVSFILNSGGAANVLGMLANLKSYESIICTDTANVNMHGTGAAEKIIGAKLISLPNADGKLTPDLILSAFEKETAWRFLSTHPKILTITQSTELGTLYSDTEVLELSKICKEKDMLLHMDGSRLSYAASALNKSLKEISFDLGVDILTFSGSKIGLLMSEVLIFKNSDLCVNFEYIQKQFFQLNWRQRYQAAQLNVLFEQKLWSKNALHANTLATKLARGLEHIKIKLTQTVETNYVYCIMPRDLIPILQKEFPFYVWDEKISEVRLVTNWDTSEKDVERFLDLVSTKAP